MDIFDQILALSEEDMNANVEDLRRPPRRPRRPPAPALQPPAAAQAAGVQQPPAADQAAAEMHFHLPKPDARSALLPGMREHQDAVQRVNDAISDEMRSRVSQSREVRRMEHEKQLKAMELEALLRRIQTAREDGRPKPRASGPGFAIY